MFWYEILIAVAVLALDLGTKYGIAAALRVADHVQTGEDITFIPKVISFSYSENTGATFGSFSGNTVLLTVITSVALLLLFVFLCYDRKESRFFRTCLVLIFAGGAGNLYDRIAFGYVRDFIRFDFWPKFAIFNVADSFLTVSTILLVVYAIFVMPGKMKERKDETGEEPEDGENGEEREAGEIPETAEGESPADVPSGESPEDAAPDDAADTPEIPETPETAESDQPEESGETAP